MYKYDKDNNIELIQNRKFAIYDQISYVVQEAQLPPR